jgi:hypothetical protein
MFDNHNNTPTEVIQAWQMSTITTPAVLKNQWWSDTAPSLPAVKRRGRLRRLRTIAITVAATLVAVLVGLGVLGTLMPSALAAPAVKLAIVKTSS